MSGKRLAGFVKRTAALGLAGCMLYGVSSEAFAATLKDVFDEHYYADSYKDLKEAFGYDRDLLWNHFMTYGVKEGRNMNQLIDIVKYRELYADLDAAFGDDWEAYLDHYLTYGAKEGRETGTGFDALDYAERYVDLKAAFGDDVLALWEHYQEYGMQENRDARSQEIVAAERAAWRAAEAAKNEAPKDEIPKDEVNPGDSASGPANSTKQVDCQHGGDGWDILEYNGEGKKAKETCCKADGTVNYSFAFEYHSNGAMRTSTLYQADGTKSRVEEYDTDGHKRKMIWYYDNGGRFETEYDSNFVRIKGTSYTETGEMAYVCIPEYDSNGKVVREVTTYADNRKSIDEYDGNGKRTKFVFYDANGVKTSEGEFSDGKQISSITYNADGTKNSETVYEYDSDGNRIKSTWYGADGRINVSEYDSAGKTIKSTFYNTDGSISVSEYDSAGKQIKSVSYNADGIKKREMEWDSAGKQIRSAAYNDDGTLDYEHVYAYDSAGNKTGYTVNFGTGSKNVFVYNADGTVTVTGYRPDGSISHQYTQDANGNIIN